MSKYVVCRADDDYRIPSNDIYFDSNGVWIYDDLETNYKDFHTFIPYCNIRQVVRYSDEVAQRENKELLND